MNMLIITLILFSGLVARADGAKYFCKERAEFEKRTVVLTQVTDLAIKEGDKTSFTLEIYTYSKTPQISVKGTVEMKDVMLTFTSQDQKVRFEIYMDELDQASLNLKGENKSIPFECN